ncbi:MAG: hypothetical protein R2847_02025 [Bacteroidia bacterium]
MNLSFGGQVTIIQDGREMCLLNSAQNSSGATQLGTSFVTSGTTTTKTYVQETYSFTPGTTGDYYFAIRVNATGVPLII